jgi:RimJ/RimL family protein N-acetyltransferase
MSELETSRLYLRSFSDDDLDSFSALTAKEGFMRFSGGGTLDREKTAALLERIMIRTRQNLPAQFVIFDRAKTKLIGYCGFFLQTVDGVEELEIGYRLHPDHWNRGIASEASQAVRDHAFRDLKLERVISLIHPDNHASRRVAEKMGMKLEKHTTFKTFPTDVFAISRAEWERLLRDA